MPRASWKGYIRISLVSVPVEGYTASAAGQSQISLNQLHQDCGERIRYKKTCPVHGEVTTDEIVMGYEYEKDQYAVIDPEEVENLRSEADRSINVDRFVEPSEVDPLYFSGKAYYLLPNGAAGRKPYALLHRAMVDAGVVGLAQVVISNREQLVALRPVGKLLAISVLQYAADLKPVEEFERMLENADVSAQELKLAKTLIDATREDNAKLESYHDLYAERLRELVEAKIEGREIVKHAATKAPPTINLIDALKASLDYKKTRAAAAKTRAKTASGAAAKTKRPATTKKRRTG
jgi:DNA end-binding protein Ku